MQQGLGIVCGWLSGNSNVMRLAIGVHLPVCVEQGMQQGQGKSLQMARAV